jgi:tetratricopeptide (TPR) repeat protein
MTSSCRVATSALICLFLAGAVAPFNVSAAGARQIGDKDQIEAREALNQGVDAYKQGHFDEAIADFRRAKELDPSLTNAQLYLATAYASQYVPGAPSADNLRHGEQAIDEFKELLEKDPANLSAIDGIGSILYNMGSSPFDLDKIKESRSYHEKHIEIQPTDPEPHYWVGVIDWAIAFRANRALRDEYNLRADHPIDESDPLPPGLSAQLERDDSIVVAEGISELKKAMELRPDYDDAMAYLNLLYRQQADMEASQADRDDDLRMADDLVDQVKAIKMKRANSSPPTH